MEGLFNFFSGDTSCFSGCMGTFVLVPLDAHSEVDGLSKQDICKRSCCLIIIIVIVIFVVVVIFVMGYDTWILMYPQRICVG